MIQSDLRNEFIVEKYRKEKQLSFCYLFLKEERTFL